MFQPDNSKLYTETYEFYILKFVDSLGDGVHRISKDSIWDHPAILHSKFLTSEDLIDRNFKIVYR